VLAGIISLSLRNGGHLILFAPLSASGGNCPSALRLRRLWILDVGQSTFFQMPHIFDETEKKARPYVDIKEYKEATKSVLCDTRDFWKSQECTRPILH